MPKYIILGTDPTDQGWQLEETADVSLIRGELDPTSGPGWAEVPVVHTGSSGTLYVNRELIPAVMIIDRQGPSSSTYTLSPPAR